MADMRLLVFKVNQLGDNVVFLPVVQWLRAHLPELDLTVLTSPVAAPLYEVCTPGVRVITADTKSFNAAWKRPARLIGLHRQIQALSPEVCLLADDQGNVAHLLAWMAGAGIRVGGRHARVKLNGLLTHLEELDLTEHIALQNWRIMKRSLEAMGLVADSAGAFPPPPDLSAFCSGDAEGGVIIHPGASRDYKRWPMERYVALANALSSHAEVIFIRQKHESENLLSDTVRLVEPASLQEFIGRMSSAALFIGNNSGPMNIASALGTPGIVFSGPSTAIWDPAWHPERFRILRDPKLSCQPCDKADHPVNACQNGANPMSCMTRWSVEEVHEIALGMLAKA
jgi:ADP-heptose:LPS heptosyltransferase